MTKNDYKLIGKFSSKEPSTKNIFDLLYSVFSFKLLNEYFINYIIITILDTVTKKISNKEIITYNTTILTNKDTFFLDHLYWSISESKLKKNRENLLFQKEVHSLSNLSDAIERIIIEVYKSINMKTSPKLVDKVKKEIFKKMELKKMIPFLEKNHLPPLASENSYKSHKIKEKRTVNMVTDEDCYDYYIYRVNDIVSKIPISYSVTGFQMKRLREENNVVVNLRYSILKKYKKLLKNRYTGTNNFNNAVFYLLTYYNLNRFLNETGDFFENIPKIKNTKLNNLYNKSIELIGTPFSVPSGKKYFGLFPDIEQHFGSLGSFYDVEPYSGIYSIHFPLSYYFIKDTIQKVEKWLDDSEENLTFLLWVPIKKIYRYEENFDLSTSILLKVYEELIPKLEQSEFLYEKYFYLYNKLATERLASHLVFVLSNK